MSKSKNSNQKICPMCNREYSEKDNYCDTDGSRLEAPETQAHSSGAEGQRIEQGSGVVGGKSV